MSLQKLTQLISDTEMDISTQVSFGPLQLALQAIIRHWEQHTEQIKQLKEELTKKS